jgi:hypothetical protein
MLEPSATFFHEMDPSLIISLATDQKHKAPYSTPYNTRSIFYSVCEDHVFVYWYRTFKDRPWRNFSPNLETWCDQNLLTPARMTEG